MMRIVVDLPAPLGPRKPVTRPGSAVKVTSSTAVKAPYRLVTFSTVIMVLLGAGLRAGRGSGDVGDRRCLERPETASGSGHVGLSAGDLGVRVRLKPLKVM